MNIDEAIKKGLENNNDKRLAILNIVGIALDNFTTMEMAEFYQKEYDTDLRYFLEQRIARIYY